MYNLNLYENVLSGDGYIGNVTSAASAWQRSIRSNGGYWLGTFEVLGTTNQLQHFFDTYIGFHIKESVGPNTTWEGMIGEMDLMMNGIVRRRSLDRIGAEHWGNAVRVVYTDKRGKDQETGYDTNVASIRKYGRKEIILSMDRVTSEEASNARAQYLATYAHPWSFVVGPASQDRLSVAVWGYAYTMNWQISSIQERNTSGQLSIYLTDIINTDCEFITPTKITTNTVASVRKTSTKTLCWDLIERLILRGDNNLNKYRGYVVANRGFIYEQIDLTPRYRWMGGGIRDLSSGFIKNPWEVQPSVVRDVTSTIRGKETGSWLNDRRDMYMEEVTVGARSGLSFKTSRYSEYDIMQSQREFDKWITEKRGGGGRRRKPPPAEDPRDPGQPYPDPVLDPTGEKARGEKWWEEVGII